MKEKSYLQRKRNESILQTMDVVLKTFPRKNVFPRTLLYTNPGKDTSRDSLYYIIYADMLI